MRTLSPSRAAPNRTSANRKRAPRRKPASSPRRRFDSALPRFSLVPLLPTGRSISIPRVEWSLPRFRLRWDWLIALALLLVIGYTAYWTQSDERFFIYRDQVRFENVGYLNADELYQLAEIDTWNVFWLRSESIRQRLLSHAYVSDAQVTIEWQPARVTIRVLPTEPVAVWLSGKGRFWVMRNGFTRSMERDAIPALPQIIDPMLEARTVTASEGAQIQQGVLDATLTLIQRVAGLNGINYDNELGLNFALPDTGYYVYWGDDRNFDKKIVNLEAAKRLLANGQTVGNVIDLRTADRPVIR